MQNCLHFKRNISHSTTFVSKTNLHHDAYPLVLLWNTVACFEFCLHYCKLYAQLLHEHLLYAISCLRLLFFTDDCMLLVYERVKCTLLCSDRPLDVCRCRVVVCWCVSSRAGLQATWSLQLSVCRSTTAQCRRSSAAVVDLASQAAVVSAGRQPSTVHRTTDQATTAALSPANVHTTVVYASVQ